MSVRRNKRFRAGGFIAGFAIPLMQVAAVTQASAQTPISMVSNASLNFGAIHSGAAGGSVTVTPAGHRRATGGVTLASAALVSAASFTVTGDPHALYSIVLPSSVSVGQGSRSMSLVNFVSNPSGVGTLNSRGEQVLNVGATLQVPPGQATTPTLTFHVTVTYN